jgi:hypothetical protein
MVNNSTNINKSINYLSPQIIKHKQRPRLKALEAHVLAWDKHKNMAWLNRSTI